MALLPRFVDVRSLQVYLLDEENGLLVRASSWVAENFSPGCDVHDPIEAAPASISPGRGIRWRAVETGHTYNVPDVRQEPLCADPRRT